MIGLINFTCTKCGVKLKAPERKAGKLLPCPKCQTELMVPPAILLVNPPPLATPVQPAFPPIQPQAPVASFASPTIHNVTHVNVVNSVPTAQIAPPSQALPALVNFFLPSIGYLLQGRLGAFLAFWFLFFLCLIIAFVTLGIGTILIPALWLVSVVDSATYNPHAVRRTSGMAIGIIAVVFAVIVGAAVFRPTVPASPKRNSPVATNESPVVNKEQQPQAPVEPLRMDSPSSAIVSTAKISDASTEASTATTSESKSSKQEIQAAKNLQLGRSLLIAGKRTGAKRFFESVIAEFPTTEAAKEAQSELNKLKP